MKHIIKKKGHVAQNNWSLLITILCNLGSTTFQRETSFSHSFSPAKHKNKEILKREGTAFLCVPLTDENLIWLKIYFWISINRSIQISQSGKWSDLARVPIHKQDICRLNEKLMNLFENTKISSPNTRIDSINLEVKKKAQCERKLSVLYLF